MTEPAPPSVPPAAPPPDVEPWEAIEAIAGRGDAEALEAYLDTLTPGETARAIGRLDEARQADVLRTLAPDDAADLLEDMPPPQAVDLIEQLHPSDAVAILGALPSDTGADLVGDLDDDAAEAIFAAMDPHEASALRRLAAYDDDVAGGLMQTELLAFPESFTVRDVLADMRRNAEAYADYDVQYAYVVDDRRRLVGVLRLRDLVLARDDRPVGAIMIRTPLSVRDDDALEDLEDFFDREHLIGVPVLDADGRLLGVVRRHDVEEARGERAESDFLKAQGIVGGEELRTMPLLRRASRRLSWLSVNIVLNIVAASVIAVFQDTLSAVIALAVFLPIISDMSGCSGNQAVAVSMRELTLGVATPADWLRVWRKEIAVGLVNGLVLGALVALAAWLWKGNAWLGLVAGAALGANTVVAVSIGGTVPLVLKRLGMDPALASGPILTTITDMCGFLLALGLATVLLARLI